MSIQKVNEALNRIVAAMDRIQQQVDVLDFTAQVQTSDYNEERLLQALHEANDINEKVGNHLALFMQKLMDKQSQLQPSDHHADYRQLELELQKLKRTSQNLRESNAALRKTNELGELQPDLISTALKAELESLQSERAVDVAEIDCIMAQLVPLLNLSENTLNKDEK
ncbi:MAG: hypothetical protein OXC62_02785 [Aestuariivita sp.]|nr:hypothetical protein [Aestuariivita sp.]